MRGQKQLFSQEAKGSASQLWATPRDLIPKLESTYGEITLDAAATERSRVCHNYLGPDHVSEARRDALYTGWSQFNLEGGPVWLNPPYHQRTINDWFTRALGSVMYGGTHTMLILVPARTSNKWFHEYGFHNLWCDEILFGKGRLTFLEDETMEPVRDRNGNPTNAPFPSAVLVFRSRPREVGTMPKMGVF